MANLFQIQHELKAIFDEIEENDGEVTDDLYQQLLITKENLEEKLTNYVKVIKHWEGDAATCKAEAKRLGEVAKVRENKVERFKNIILDAVEQFGVEGKTNKFIELPTMRLSTRGTEAVNVDEERIKLFILEFERYLREIYGTGALYSAKDVDLQGILVAVNANLKAMFETEIGGDANPETSLFKPFTLADLTTMVLKFEFKFPIYELFRDGGKVIEAYGHNAVNANIIYGGKKDDWKTIIKVADASVGSEQELTKPTVANLVKNTSLIIK